MNHMREVAEMLGVELEEEFTLDDRNKDCIYKLSISGLCYIRNAWTDELVHITFIRLLRGEIKIIKAPKFPEDDTYYCFVTNLGNVCSSLFDKKFMEHIHRFKTGNYFLTEEEITEEDIKRIVAMLNSPESLV